MGSLYCSNIQTFHCIFSKPEVHSHIHKGLTLDSTLTPVNPVHKLPSYILTAHFNNISPCTTYVSQVISFLQVFPPKTSTSHRAKYSATLILFAMFIINTFRQKSRCYLLRSILQALSLLPLCSNIPHSTFISSTLIRYSSFAIIQNIDFTFLFLVKFYSSHFTKKKKTENPGKQRMRKTKCR
jgi:hypothetical protein